MGVMDLRRRIMLNEPHIVTTTPAGIANFSTDMIAPLKSCKVEFSPVQSGSGDPSPDNVRPISGWTGVNVYRAGKNLLNVDRTEGTPNPSDVSNATSPRVMDADHYYVGLQSTNYYYKAYASATITNGTIIVNTTNNNSYGTGFPISVKGGKKYTLSATASNVLISFGYYDSEWHYLSGSSSVFALPTTITIPDNASYVTIIFRSGVNNPYTYSNIQFEVGETATPYEPYTGSTIPLDWTTEAGTVYGGYVDLVTGELVATSVSESFDLTGRSYTTDNGFDSWIIDAQYASTVASSSNGKMCDKATYSYGGAGVGNSHFYITSQGRIILYFPEEQHRTDTVQFVYPLATPITYQLTPTQLKSLRGVNNIWSDANGDISVKYWTH